LPPRPKKASGGFKAFSFPDTSKYREGDVFFLAYLTERQFYLRRRIIHMPKLKSIRGAVKRFKATGGGKVRHYKAFASHLLTSKTTKRKRNLRKSVLVNSRDMRNLKRMLPYL
jgi:large subunit ribosomal protein L35